jgi:hypothetical protein
MKTLFRSTLLLGIGTLLTSCMGQSSDPMQKYSNLKTGMPTAEQSETQTVALDVFTSATVPYGTEFADLKLQGPNEVNTANFIEGQEGILYFKLSPKSPKILKYKIDITDFPVSTRPTLVETQLPHVHGIKWTPPMGVIPSGQNFISLKLQLQTTVYEASDVNLNGMMKTDKIDVVVSKNNTLPKILGRVNLDAGIDEGQTVPFTVDLEDPASATSPKFPEIQITSYTYSNTEAFRADGAKYVTLDYSKTVNPERHAGSKTKWRFYYLLQVDQLPLDRDRRGIENPAAPAVDVCFHIRGTSVLDTDTPKQQVCFKGRYAAQLPMLKWEDESLKEIKAGGTTVLKFKAMSSNGLGIVSIKDMAKQISGLTGKKELVCSPEAVGNQATQLCELSWTPTCVKAPLAKKLTLKVDNVVGKKTKSQSFVKEFSVVPSEENCPPPAAKPAPVKPAAKPAAEKPAAKPATKPAAVVPSVTVTTTPQANAVVEGAE